MKIILDNKLVTLYADGTAIWKSNERLKHLSDERNKHRPGQPAR